MSHVVVIGKILLVSACPGDCVSCYLEGTTTKCAVDGCSDLFVQDSSDASCTGQCLHLQCLEQSVFSIGPTFY